MTNFKEWIQKNKQLFVTLVVMTLFLVATFFTAYRDTPYLILVPLVGLILFLFVTRLETALMLIALLTPFSILLPVGESGIRLSLPAEPLMMLLSAILVFRLLIDKNYDRRLLRHPVSIALLLQLGWILVTACTSQIPLVSFKFLASRLWFVIPFYFAAAQIFANPKRITQFFTCYAVGLAVVILISTFKTLGDFHNLQTLHRVMRPFYNDHTAYGCVIALFIPATIALLFSRGGRGYRRLFYMALAAIFLMGVFFSYSRAAWVSVAAAVGAYVLIRLGMKVRWMFLLVAIAGVLFFSYQGDVMYKMGKNRQDSSLDLAGQVKSISNISTDASNLERLNRWACALRMWQEHPVTGTGPGTYQFLYGSYQRSYQLSTISTNSGNLGNAHSEYIGPLSEEGVPGTLLVLAVFLLTFVAGVRVFRTAADRTLANIALGVTLILVTYYVHGVFNNFLDTDKLSVPFWGFTAVIVALDVYCKKKDDPSFLPPCAAGDSEKGISAQPDE